MLKAYQTRLKYYLRSKLRENSFCDRRMETLLRNEKLSERKLELQNNQLLLSSLRSARSYIPRYKGLAVPDDPDEAVGFLTKCLPITTKEELIANRALFYPAAGLKQLAAFKGKTSGTSGTPLQIYRDLNSIWWENAFVYRHWSWFGIKRGGRRCLLRGDAIIPIDQKKPPYWTYNSSDNQLILSLRHLNEETVSLFKDLITEFRPAVLQAYPSAVFELAHHLEKRNEKVEVPFIFTSSEILYPHQRSLVSERLNGRVVDLYGMAERVALATECEFGHLHVNSDYSHLEIVDDKGYPTDDYGKVVGTTYHNHLMPLIRYQLSDVAKWKKGHCPCGRTYPMIEGIEGRTGDTIYDLDGNPISQALVTFAFSGLKSIKKSQVAQVRDDLIELRIVPFGTHSGEGFDSVASSFKANVCSRVALRVKIVDDLPRSASGKFSWIVNETRGKH